MPQAGIQVSNSDRDRGFFSFPKYPYQGMYLSSPYMPLLRGNGQIYLYFISKGKRDLVEWGFFLVKHERNGHRSVLRSVYLVTLKTCVTNGNMHVRGGVELGWMCVGGSNSVAKAKVSLASVLW
jgi:hypothetical protein